MTSNENDIGHPVHLKKNTSTAFGATKVSTDINVWHNRLAHASSNVLNSLPRHTKDILEVRGSLDACHPCRLGKAHRQSFKSSFEPAKQAGEVVHSDLAGSLPKRSHGLKYIITFVLDQTDIYSIVLSESLDI